MTNAALVVCERRNTWAVALRRSLAAAGGFQIVETRTLDDCRQEARKAAWAFIVCEATAQNVDAVLRLLVSSQANTLSAPVVVVAERSMQPWEAALREAGAVHAVFSPRDLAGVVRMAARHAARRPAEDTSSLSEWAWSLLPWGS